MISFALRMLQSVCRVRECCGLSRFHHMWLMQTVRLKTQRSQLKLQNYSKAGSVVCVCVFMCKCRGKQHAVLDGVR